MSKVSKGLLLLATLGLVGCDKEEKPTPVVEDKSVRLRSFKRNHTASGVTERPQDFAANSVELLLLEGETFKSLPGALASPGEYAFADVPDGTYYLRRGGSYVVTSARRVDLSSDWLGRADAQELTAPAALAEARLDINGLQPWPESDEGPGGLQLVSGELDVAGNLDTFNRVLQPGTMSVSGEVVSYDNFTNPFMYRFEQARGDRAWVNQFVPRNAGTLADGSTLKYGAVARSLHLPPFSYDGSEPLPVNGTFSVLPSKQFALNWKLSSFMSHVSDAHPAATAGRPAFALHPAAHGVEDGWVGYSGELLSFNLPMGYDTDIRATLDYGNPFPSTWGEVAWFSVPFRVEYAFPGTTEPLVVGARLDVYENASSLGAGPLQPLVLAPRDLRLDGKEAYSQQSLALGSHVISWQPPASGQASGYRLRLRRYEWNAEWGIVSNAESFVFWLGGDATSVRLPPELLKPASHYILQLTAISAPGFSAENSAALYKLPAGHADTLSGLLSTP
ncbi:fibronectin type III domain-containing protein [Archangium minus]|uniref:Fibronectin type III domain-containing protein n=1 Tax=Archangium minus TaxID=83450 RepID=A0ABY9WIK0_9BACT|nr:fibronectin type III domain-containing protein [Archangium minus]